MHLTLPKAFSSSLPPQSVLRDLNKKFGANSVVFLGAKEAADVERTPSGSLTLDLALGGGYPVGRIVEIFGPGECV